MCARVCVRVCPCVRTRVRAVRVPICARVCVRAFARDLPVDKTCSRMPSPNTVDFSQIAKLSIRQGNSCSCFRIRKESTTFSKSFVIVSLPTGPFTHAIFDAISDAISRAKRALPYPAPMLFSRSIVWIGKKGITYCFKTPFIPISANLVVFCRSVTRLKTRAGLAGAGFVRKIASKSHRNRMKNRMCKRALRVRIICAKSLNSLPR